MTFLRTKKWAVRFPGGQALFIWLFLLFCVSGCIQEPDFGSEAQISCSSDSECPEGWACKEDSEDHARCVHVTGSTADDLPPELASDIIIDPGLGKDGTIFTLCFSAKEELDQYPIVQVDTGAGLSNLTLLEELPALCDGSSWAYSYTADISKDAAGTRPTGESTLKRPPTPSGTTND